MFETEVHQNPSYSNATKFNFLNSCLKGKAKGSIAGLAPNNDNYPVAISILKDRYGQPNKVQAAYMRALYTIEKPTDSRASLRIFADRIEALIRGLEAQKVKLSGAAGDLLVCILQDKLSSDVRRSLVRQHGSTEFDLNEFCKSLQHEIEILEDTPVQQHVKKHHHPESNQKQGQERDSLPPSNAANNSSPPPPRCHLCEADHFVNNCTAFTTGAKRSDKAKKMKLCYNCLSSGHTTADCQSAHRCKTCGMRHHTSLHFE